MNAKERVKAALRHEEPDRVPLFELAFGNALASKVMGREIRIARAGGDAYWHILVANMGGRKARRQFIRQASADHVALFDKLPYDMIMQIPLEYLQPAVNQFGMGGTNDLYRVKIEEIAPYTWRTSHEDGFWAVFRYYPEGNMMTAIDDSIKQGGISELRRYVKVLESQPLDMNEYVEDALDSIRVMVESEPVRSGRLFALGHVDVALPLFLPYGSLFLHAMASEAELIDRYMEITTEGIMPVLRAQLELGVDGICGANDWCYNKGPMISPRMFRRFIVPHLKRIVDECHKHGVPFIKHLDGNTKLHLPILVDEVGIDAYHSIEPSADMDIGWVKQEYGDRLTLIGNIDCGDVMVNGTPEGIREQVRQIIRAAAPGGGFIFATSNAMTDGTPLENMWAMFDAVQRFGQYPMTS